MPMPKKPILTIEMIKKPLSGLLAPIRENYDPIVASITPIRLGRSVQQQFC